jgi:hypothetical protein
LEHGVGRSGENDLDHVIGPGLDFLLQMNPGHDFSSLAFPPDHFGIH